MFALINAIIYDRTLVILKYIPQKVYERFIYKTRTNVLNYKTITLSIGRINVIIMN